MYNKLTVNLRVFNVISADSSISKFILQIKRGDYKDIDIILYMMP